MGQVTLVGYADDVLTGFVCALWTPGADGTPPIDDPHVRPGLRGGATVGALLAAVKVALPERGLERAGLIVPEGTGPRSASIRVTGAWTRGRRRTSSWGWR